MSAPASLKDTKLSSGAPSNPIGNILAWIKQKREAAGAKMAQTGTILTEATDKAMPKPKGSAKPLLPGARRKHLLPGATHHEPLISLTKHDFVKEHKKLVKLLEVGDKLEREAKDQQAELDKVTGGGKRMTWIQALNQWNKGNKKWYIPKKGTKEYDAVKALMR
jgi:hypothetical protein